MKIRNPLPLLIGLALFWEGWDVERQVRRGGEGGPSGGGREGGPCLRAFQGGQTLGLSPVGDTGSFGTCQHSWKTPEMHSVQVLWVWMLLKVSLLWKETCIRAWPAKKPKQQWLNLACFFRNLMIATAPVCQMFLGCNNLTVQWTGLTKLTKCKRWKDWKQHKQCSGSFCNVLRSQRLKRSEIRSLEMRDISCVLWGRFV